MKFLKRLLSFVFLWWQKEGEHEPITIYTALKKHEPPSGMLITRRQLTKADVEKICED